jgi:hypothetical protein
MYKRVFLSSYFRDIKSDQLKSHSDQDIDQDHQISILISPPPNLVFFILPSIFRWLTACKGAHNSTVDTLTIFLTFLLQSFNIQVHSNAHACEFKLLFLSLP